MGLFSYDELSRGLGNAELEAVRARTDTACVTPGSPECTAARAELSVWEVEFAKAGKTATSGPAPSAAPQRSFVERWAELEAAFFPPLPPQGLVQQAPPPPPPPPAPAPEPAQPQVVIMPAAAAGGGIALIALAIGLYAVLKK